MADETWEQCVYQRESSIVFLKTHAAFGGLSNMAGGYPLLIDGIYIRTSEALYQACRFPHIPEVQRLILAQASPMAAKMKSKPYREKSRSDWPAVQVAIMRWCLRVKLAQNWERFGELLFTTDSLPIVEESRRDRYWGATPTEKNTLTGCNVLGHLLMELREELRGHEGEKLRHIEPLPIDNFLLLGRKIGRVDYGNSQLTQFRLFS